MRPHAHAHALAAAVALLAACGTATPAEPGDQPGPVPTAPPGADVAQPFPIDRGDDGVHTPGSYKGLWLRLADAGRPEVAPVDGVVGVVCVGMSNAVQECRAWIDGLAGGWSAQVDARVRVVNCAVGGHAIERWNDPAYDHALWDDCADRRLPAAGVRPDQVRVLYHKAANQFTRGPGGAPLPLYPDPGSDYHAFVRHLEAFAARVPEKFPGVRAVYTSSRSYGGFAGNPARGEPLSYEEGHALNGWLAGRVAGGAAGVWHGWGPYLWAPACATGVTNGAGACYERSDYVADGVHPSPAGEAKIARLIHERFLREPWYRRGG
jgi:hypothetical protein